MNRVTQVIIVALMVFSFAVSLYFTLSYYPTCDDIICFQDAMRACKHAVYTNEGPDASWKYRVEGKSENLCSVRVTLLQAKKGGVEIDRLVGYDMVCGYTLGVAAYPEQDLDRCHGRLKEEIQSLLIDKLQKYVIGNLNPLHDELNKIVGSQPSQTPPAVSNVSAAGNVTMTNSTNVSG